MRSAHVIRVSLLALVGTVAFGCPRTGGKGQVALDPVYSAAKDKVFIIGGAAAGYQGTVFLVKYKNKDYLVTNFHVISMAKDLFIENDAKVAYKDIRVVAVDRIHDVALLEAKGLPSSIDGLPFTHDFQTSEKIFVIGYPDMRSKENHQNFGTGVVSDANYIAPDYMGKGTSKYIQLTAPINPGNSGSPVLDGRGHVVGVVAWRFTKEADIQGGNYAVPFQYVSALFEEVDKRATQDTAALYPEGAVCSDDDQCQWTHFCIAGKCQKLRDVGQTCDIHNDCYLPYNCFNKVCSKMGSIGDFCQNDSQCVPPNYCILSSCRPLAKKGEDCKYDMDCVSPLYCILGKCVSELSAAGGTCGQAIDCLSGLSCIGGICQEVKNKPCGSDGDCTPLYCILGSCRDLGKEGESCSQTIDCQSGLKCDAGVCRYSTLSDIGGPCAVDYDCKLPWYCIGGTCQASGSVPKSTTPYTPCTSDVQCQPPLYCIVNTCRPLGNSGDPCKIDADCNIPYYCTGGVCAGSGPGGATGGGFMAYCSSDSDCQYPYYCIVNACRNLSNVGEVCSYDGDCVSGLYCSGGLCSATSPTKSTVPNTPCTSDSQCQAPLFCITNQCLPLSDVGGPCTFNYDCKSPYNCIGGACAQPGPVVTTTASDTPGALCQSDAGCKPPLYCILQSCRPLGKEGEACGTSADCVMPLTCTAGKCTGTTPVKPADTTAGGAVECKGKDGDKECKKKGKGFKYCIMNKCKKNLSEKGEACQYSTDCKKGLLCIVGLCKSEQNKRGDPCRSNDDCERPYLCKNNTCQD